jgi:hypothetical protein
MMTLILPKQHTEDQIEGGSHRLTGQTMTTP